MSSADWNVRTRANQPWVPITWGGKRIDWRINWDGLNSDRRTAINNAFEFVNPKVGSGGQNLGQTSLKPNKAQEAFEEQPGVVFVYAREFDEGGSGALAFSEQYWQNGLYVGAIVLFNTLQYNHPTFGNPAGFRAIVRHEIGHAVGLLHCSSNQQLMNANLPKLDYQWGDLEGFGVLKAARFL